MVKMGFLGDMAKNAVRGLQDRANKVSERKEVLGRKYEYADDEEILHHMSRISATSEDFAALSLILQDRGLSSEEIVLRCKKIKHNL